MPDEAADPTMSSETTEPGGHEKPVEGAETASDPFVTCPQCGAEVLPRDSSYGVDEPSRGPACPSCGASLEPRV
jgi:hypothetical protein